MLKPQHCTPPVVVSAQLKLLPAVIAATPLDRPVTGTAVALLVVLPLPSWPFPLLPQHWTPPALLIAQAWVVPTVTARTPLVRPVTFTGVALVVVVPSPSWLLEL